MSWTTTPKVRITLGGEERKTLETTDPATVKDEIMRIARDEGLARFDVFVNNRHTTPETFDTIFNEETSKDTIIVDIVKVDKSA